MLRAEDLDTAPVLLLLLLLLCLYVCRCQPKQTNHVRHRYHLIKAKILQAEEGGLDASIKALMQCFQLPGVKSAGAPLKGKRAIALSDRVSVYLELASALYKASGGVVTWWRGGVVAALKGVCACVCLRERCCKFF
jgi:hypothetical protein